MYIYLIQVIQGHQRTNTIIEDYCDSVVAQSQPLFGQDKKCIQMLLYFDEVELYNPLGSSRKIHKLGKPKQ